MKKILKPTQQEEALYFSDFSGKPFGALLPPVELTFNFNYGSKYDMSTFTLDLDDSEIQEFLDIIKKRLNSDTKELFAKLLDKGIEQFGHAMDSRDLVSCEYYAANNELLNSIIS